MNPIDAVDKLAKKYLTNNPFDIVDHLGIIIINKPFSNIKGCYSLIHRNKFIFLNSNLDYNEKLVICAHELGHAVMHPKINCKFMQNYTLFSTNRIEIEANTFCAHLLLPNLEEYEGYTYKQIAATTHIPLEVVKLRTQI